MAVAQPIGARCCVECGTDFVRKPGIGRPRKSCFICVPATAPRPPIERTCVDCGTRTASAGGKPRTRCPACAAVRIKSKAAERWALIAASRQPRLGYCIECSVTVEACGRGGSLPARCRDCTRRRHNLLKARLRIEPHTCQGCGIEFRPKGRDRTKYCSRACAFARAAERKKARLSQPKPPAPIYKGACIECGCEFESLRRRLLCGDACAKARDKAKHLAAHPPRPRQYVYKTLVPGVCAECSISFLGPEGRKCCGQRCARKHGKRIHKGKRRARTKSGRIEAVNPIKVFERDAWRCQSCRKPTPRKLRGSSAPMAPEMDHIVPLSKGGEHSYRNVQCLCRQCNGAKGDGAGGQLRLFG